MRAAQARFDLWSSNFQARYQQFRFSWKRDCLRQSSFAIAVGRQSVLQTTRSELRSLDLRDQFRKRGQIRDGGCSKLFRFRKTWLIEAT